MFAFATVLNVIDRSKNQSGDASDISNIQCWTSNHNNHNSPLY